MKRTLFTLLALILVITSLLASCQKAPEKTTGADKTSEVQTATEEPKDETPIRLMALQGPTGMGLAPLLQKGNAGESDLNLEATIVTSAEISNIAAAIANGSCDIAAVPVNLAAQLYKKTDGGVQILCVNTLGVLSILENGNEIGSFKDLKGKTIYATGQGSTPEYVLRYLLQETGIAEDVTLEFVADHTQLASMMASNLTSLGMLPEPNVSVVLSSNPSFRKALDITEEWNKVTEGKADLVQGVYIARKEFIEAHPQAVRAFIKAYDESQKAVNADPAAAAKAVVETGILASEPIAAKAIPGCHITCVTGEEMKAGVSRCFEVLFAAEPSSIGEIPSDEIYYLP